MTRAILAGMAAGAMALGSPASAQILENPGSAFKDTTSKKAWHATVEKTERGYLIGNPDAEAQLIMFTSYACEGCHEFAFKGDPELDIALLAPGLLSLEIRHRFAHPADLPLALLASCGEPRKFKVNHAMFMRDQKRWKDRWNNASAFNRELWSRGGRQARLSLASALDFDEMMARRRGYSRMDLTRCLSDERAASKLLSNSLADTRGFELPTDPDGYSRPHFVLDGEKLEGVHDWDSLYPILEKRFRPSREAD